MGIGLGVLALSVCLAEPSGERPEPPPSTVPSLIGQPPPPLRVGDWVKGSPLTEFEKGKVYVVDFWATWCGPCQAAIPHLTELARRYEGRVEVVGVSISERRNGPEDNSYLNVVRKFVNRLGDRMDYRVAVDTPDQQMYRTWFKTAGTVGIPTAYIIDARGRVAWIGIGTASVVERITAEVLAGTFDPKEETQRQKAAELEAQQRSEADRALARSSAKAIDPRFPGYREAMERGDSAAALASLDAAFRERPTSEAEGAYQWKLMLLLQRNRPAEVNSYAKHLLQAFPDNDDVVSFVSACLVATSEEARFDTQIAFDAAVKSEAAAKPGTRWAQFAKWRLGWAHYHLGNRQEAIRLVKAALAEIQQLKATLDLEQLESECREALVVFQSPR